MKVLLIIGILTLNPPVFTQAKAYEMKSMEECEETLYIVKNSYLNMSIICVEFKQGE